MTWLLIGLLIAIDAAAMAIRYRARVELARRGRAE